jgi:hypothetical protein
VTCRVHRVFHSWRRQFQIIHRASASAIRCRHSGGMAELPELRTRAQFRASGLTDRQIDNRLASGSLVATRRGIIHVASDPAQPPGQSISTPARATGPVLPVEIRAALLSCPGRELIISHSTAARLFGLPQPLAGWPQPQFTANSGPTRRRNGVHITVAAVPEAETVIRQGVNLTSPSRTVADCLRTLPGRDSLAIIDAALHRRLTTPESVAEVLRHQARWPKVAAARQVLALADGRRESPLESWSAWAFAQTGVVSPQWQVEIHQPDGVLIGRADCWWIDGVVGEADGRSKYTLGTAERGGGENAMYEVLHDERKREQRMRDLGAEIVRWTAADVLNDHLARRLTQRIRGAIALAQGSARFTGIVTPTLLH